RTGALRPRRPPAGVRTSLAPGLTTPPPAHRDSAVGLPPSTPRVSHRPGSGRPPDRLHRAREPTRLTTRREQPIPLPGECRASRQRDLHKRRAVVRPAAPRRSAPAPAGTRRPYSEAGCLGAVEEPQCARVPEDDDRYDQEAPCEWQQPGGRLP